MISISACVAKSSVRGAGDVRWRKVAWHGRVGAYSRRPDGESSGSTDCDEQSPHSCLPHYERRRHKPRSVLSGTFARVPSRSPPSGCFPSRSPRNSNPTFVECALTEPKRQRNVDVTTFTFSRLWRTRSQQRYSCCNAVDQSYRLRGAATVRHLKSVAGMQLFD